MYNIHCILKMDFFLVKLVYNDKIVPLTDY